MGVRISEKELEALLGKGHVRIAQSLRCASPTPRRSVKRPRAARLPTPHDLLWDRVHELYRLHAYRECPACIDGQYYRIDIGLPAFGVAIEMDGWEWHGKHLGDFSRDRTRQNLLTCGGWRVLRYTAKQIRQSMEAVIEEIVAACADTRAAMGGSPMRARSALAQVECLPCADVGQFKEVLQCDGRTARIFFDCIEQSGRSGTMPGAKDEGRQS